ncbi:flagellar filament capping protein FliD [Desemzia sp. FAM 23989]|uniref:flagellar filament capping protein FliD n=1 Tax=Desemzia sp. FAM 23989 TaxID=3259523 RepID=UPI0038861A00
MTSSLSFMGSYSGITMDTVEQLIQAESGKLVQYTNQQTELTSEKNAWKDINTRLDSLYKKFDELKEAATFDTKTVTNSNSSAVTVSAGTDALEGTYNVEVTKLATSSQLTSGTIEAMKGVQKSTDPLTLEGSLAISSTSSELDENGEPIQTTFEITVKSGESLKDIVTKINEKAKEEKSGLQASIVDNRIILKDSNMGPNTIEVSGDLAASLSLNSDNPDAELYIGNGSMMKVNGIEITRNSNTITDAVDGLTFNLVGVSENNKVSTVKVAEDADKTTKAVQAFVDQYNSVMSFIGDQLDVGDPSAEGNTTGALVGDSSVMRLQTQLRSMMTSSSKDSSQSIKGLSDLGIEVDRYGTATLDTAKLKEQLAENSNNVQNFFFREEPVLDANGAETGETKEVGIASQMTTFINEYIGEKTGIITTKSKTIDDMIKGLDEQITKFNERLEKKRERYITQFTALDVAMMEAESQLSYLNSQLGTSED